MKPEYFALRPEGLAAEQVRDKETRRGRKSFQRKGSELPRVLV